MRFWFTLYAADTFLHINDQINTVLDRYEAFTRGDYATAANPLPRELASQSSQGVSLIDFDDSAPSSNSATSGGGNTIDELAELFGPGASNPAPQQQQQSIPIQQQIQQIQQIQQQQPAYGMPQQQHANPNANLFAQLGMGGSSGTRTPSSVYSPQPTGGALGAQARPPFANTLSQGLIAQRTGSSTGMGTPPQGALRLGSPSPNYLASSNTGTAAVGGVPMGHALGSSANGFGGAGASIGLGLQPSPARQPPQQQQPPAQGQQGKDPFADLAGLF